MTNPNLPPQKSRGRPPQEIPPATRREIIDLAKHYKPRSIAKRVNLSRKVVHRVLEEEGILPLEKPASPKLEAFLKDITAMVKQGLKVPRILREIQAHGYQGGHTILGSLVRTLRAQEPLTVKRKIRCRFETRVAEEMQCDWSIYVVPIDGRPTRIHVLGLLLAHSRKVFYAAFRNEKQETLLEGLALGFEYFQGCALQVIFDNMATAVLGRIGPERKPLWHPRLQEFARYYGFKPVACAVRDPDRKGKKEKSFRLLEDDFIRGSTFSDWDDLTRRLKIWLDNTSNVGNNRRHGTTGLIPNEVWTAERGLLIALPDRRFIVGREVCRPVDQDCTIAVGGYRYSVPASLANHPVQARLCADHFELIDPQGTILYSRSYVDRSRHPGKLVIDPTHYANLPRRPKDQVDGGRLDRAFLQRFPSLQTLVDGLKTRMKTIAPIHLRHLIRLADIYGIEAFLVAASQAQQHRRFDAHAVQRILERDHPLPPEVTDTPLNGAGPVILGEVEESTLDDYAYLDEVPPKKENDDGQK